MAYARFADDLVILVDDYRRWDWLVKAVYQRLMEELAKLDVQVNTDKTRLVDLMQGESFGFLGFEFRRVRTLRGKWGVRYGRLITGSAPTTVRSAASERAPLSQALSFLRVDASAFACHPWCSHPHGSASMGQ